MSKHLQIEIDKLQRKVLTLASIVEEQLRTSVQSIVRKEEKSAKNIIEFDHKIDLMEIEIEEDCLKLLALHQPVAIDLRFIVAVLKINNDLERVGDMATNIAKMSIELAKDPSFSFIADIPYICELSIRMLKNSCDALFTMDAEKARMVCKEDIEVDSIYGKNVDLIKEHIVTEPNKANLYLCIVSVLRALERVADHATNIAEDVIYLIEGNIVRHSKIWN
ncbi:MAG: phosphate signaling complex protein PhoU [Chitinispirillaceae bacterium]|nr:phosphate signaling complex protein PhoU [Chitinispirillaceae bacterium]